MSAESNKEHEAVTTSDARKRRAEKAAEQMRADGWTLCKDFRGQDMWVKDVHVSPGEHFDHDGNRVTPVLDYEAFVRAPEGFIVEDAPPVYVPRYKPLMGLPPEDAEAIPAQVGRPMPEASASSTGEVRTVSATGGAKGVKDVAYHRIPRGPLDELAVLFTRGEMKYPDDLVGHPNWKRGYEWSKNIDGIERHLGEFIKGNDYDDDPENGTGVKHVIAVAWHALVLAWFIENRPEFDDRPKGEKYDGPMPTPEWLLDLVAQRNSNTESNGDAA